MNLSTAQLLIITLITSLGGLIFGFDMAVISGVLPLFKTQFSLTPAMEGWFVSSALLGCVIGVVASSHLSDKYGRRFTLMAAASLFILSTLGCVLLTAFSHIIFGRILTGVGIGIASNVVPLYLSEIAPTKDRGKLVTLYQLALTFGIVLAYISNALIIRMANFEVEGNDSLIHYLFVDERWRGMLAIAMLPSLVFFIGLFFVPESPAWSNKMETGPSSRYSELLRPDYRKALTLGLFLPIFSQLCGINVIIYYGPTILNNLGFSLDTSLYGQIMIGLANMLFTVIAIWKVDSLGRRPLYLIGTLGGAIALFFTGVLFYFNYVDSWLLAISVISFLAFFAFSIGPLKFVVVAEIFPAHIRAKAMGASILAMWISDALMGQITPFLLDGLGAAATFWVLGTVCAIAFFFVLKKLPETKGKTFDEIQDILK